VFVISVLEMTSVCSQVFYRNRSLLVIIIAPGFALSNSVQFLGWGDQNCTW